MNEFIVLVDESRLEQDEQEWFKEQGAKELVRCKDCIHGEPGACGDGVDCDGVWHDDDWFCADGERK